MASKVRGLLCLFVLSAVSIPACAPDAPPRMELADSVAKGDRFGLVLLVDGVDAETFDSLQRAGRLPNITRYLIDRGVTVRRAVASLPTITYANNVSLTTGLLPGHHGIAGNKWFDRYSLIFQDYTFIETYLQVDSDLIAPTIYEDLREDNTATILTPVRRGATRSFDNCISAGVAWYFGFHKTVNHLTTLRFEQIADIANGTGRWPKFIMAYFSTPDTVGHEKGPSDPRYTEMVIDIDRQVGNICRALEKAGLLERTYITLLPDHGFVETPNHFDVADYFRSELKIPTISRMYGRGEMFERRMARFGKARAVVVTGGNRHCSIHLRAGRHWWRRPTEKEMKNFQCAGPDGGRGDLPTLLADNPAVELVMVNLGPDSAGVRNSRGAGVIDRIRRGGEKLYRYRVTEKADPLGYASDSAAAVLMDGKYHDADTWLAATLDTGKPDVAVQLIELNDSYRSGDIVLFAGDGWDFRPGGRGGHGGLARREMIVPWIWAGPGLPAGVSIDSARTVDLAPTMLHLIGRGEAVRPGLDGKSIAESLKQATKLREVEGAARQNHE